MRIMKKRKDETCVWVQQNPGTCFSYYSPGCNHQIRAYVIPSLCKCGKKVEVKK